MFGRLGSAFFLHLAEAQAQRRRLAVAGAPPSNRPADVGPGLFLRLVGVVAIGLAVASLVSIMLA